MTQPLARRAWLLAGVLCPLAAIGIAWPHLRDPLAATYTDPIALEFLLGALAGKLCAEREVSAGVGGALLAGGMAALWLSYPALGDVRWVAWLTVGGSCAAIVVGAVALEHAGLMPRWRWLRVAGEASYAMYLFQELGFLTASLLADRWSIFAPPLVKAALGGGAAVAVGWAVWWG